MKRAERAENPEKDWFAALHMLISCAPLKTFQLLKVLVINSETFALVFHIITIKGLLNFLLFILLPKKNTWVKKELK